MLLDYRHRLRDTVLDQQLLIDRSRWEKRFQNKGCDFQKKILSGLKFCFLFLFPFLNGKEGPVLVLDICSDERDIVVGG